MRRDDDLLRELLFEYEAQEDWLIAESKAVSMPPEQLKRLGHVHLLRDAGLVTEVGDNIFRLTNDGHDYLEAIRDNGIWRKTKDAVAETGGSATLEILKQLATGFLKNKISQQTGIDL